MIPNMWVLNENIVMCDEIKWWETELMGWKWLFDGCQVSQVKTYLPWDLSDDDMQIWHQLHVSAKKKRWCWLACRPLGTVWILSAWTGDEKGLWERAKAMKVKCTAGQVKSDADLAKCSEPVGSSRSDQAALKTDPEWGCADVEGKVLQEQQVQW